MGYTKRRVDYYESTPYPKTLLNRLLHLESKIETLEQFVNNMIEEKGLR